MRDSAQIMATIFAGHALAGRDNSCMNYLKALRAVFFNSWIHFWSGEYIL